jgi:uncharacterized GH25 family protein
MNTSMKNKEIVYYDIEPNITIIQKIVGGYFTIIPLTNNKLMYVNEEGKLRQLQVNENATKMIGYKIYGNVLIVGSE